MTDTTLKIRRAIVRLAIDETTTLLIPEVSQDELVAQATKFAKARKISIDLQRVSGGVQIRRIPTAPKVSLYPEIDALQIGQSHLFELPPSMHQRVRMAASSRNRLAVVRLACIREGEFIRVTRLPMTETEQQTHGPVSAPARQSKYGLDRLAEERSIVFDLPKKEHAALRLAVHRKATMTGWTIRCRLQDDGTMLVYRNDAGAPAADSSLSTITHTQ